MAKLVGQSELKVPDHPAPRPSTLSTRALDVESNPLRILRDKNYPIVRPRMKVNIDDDASHNGNDDACESPSYLQGPEYSFSERDIKTIQQSDVVQRKEIENLNPIPLPPRDRNKVLLTNVKRHVRKHPLIIPASGLQRTLNKVTTPVEEKLPPMVSSRDVDEIDSVATRTESTSSKINYNTPRTSTKPAEAAKLQPMPIDHSYINQEDINVASTTDEQKIYTKKFIENNFPDSSFRTYENLESMRAQMDNIDSASLRFESILEGDNSDCVNDISATENIRNGFAFDNYDVPRFSCSSNRASLPGNSSHSFEHKKTEFHEKYPNYSQPRNELSDNALFLKFRESAEAGTNDSNAKLQRPTSIEFDRFGNGNDDDDEKILERKLQDLNSVSCEDLLEFADKKPKGKERGIESDEVRIMTKVLGAIVSSFKTFYTIDFSSFLSIHLILRQATPEQCIVALDFIEWNVHRAIKIISLQNALRNKRPVAFEEAVEALQKYEWDLHATTIKLSLEWAVDVNTKMCQSKSEDK